jgi:ADP-heptose:LPS heptosyltransferase
MGHQQGHRSAGADVVNATPRFLLLAMLPIGDTLFLTPTLRALRGRYPNAHLTTLAYTRNAPLLSCVPALTDVVILPPVTGVPTVGHYRHLIGDLQGRAFDAAIDFTSPAFKWIPLVARIQRRLYLPLDPLWWLVPTRHAYWRSTHATRIYYDCAAQLDLPPWERIDQRPWLDLPSAAFAEARGVLAACGSALCGVPLIALHPGGDGMRGLKRWKARDFAFIADRLHETWGARLLIVGGPAEIALAHDVAHQMAAPARILAGQLTLLGSAALLSLCNLFIGNDSGLLHLAACQGTPYVGIFGPTCLANFQPVPLRPRQGRLVAALPPSRRMVYFVGARPIWQRPRRRDAEAALERVTPAMVLAQANDLLQEHRLPWLGAK